MKCSLLDEHQFIKPPEIVLVYPSQDQVQDQCFGSIYISNLPAASNLQILKQHEVRAVITVARGAFLEHSKEDLPNYLYLPADDVKEFDISQFFEKTYMFIQKNRKKGNVLVHCMFGKSRSAAIIIAYLIKKYGMTFEAAWSQIRQYRPCIKPNSGFRQMLINYEKVQLLERRNKERIKQDKLTDICQENKEAGDENARIKSKSAVLNSSNTVEVSKDVKPACLKETVIDLSKQNDQIMKKIQQLKKDWRFSSRWQWGPRLTLNQIKAKCHEQANQQNQIINPQS